MTLAIAIIVVALLASVTAGYLNWIAGRHERLAARAGAAWAALDAQLVRRAAAARTLGALRGDRPLMLDAGAVLGTGQGAAIAAREEAENTLGRALRARPDLTADPDGTPAPRVAPQPIAQSAPTQPPASPSAAEAVEGEAALAALAARAARRDLRHAAARVTLSRQFYNDAVRDLRAIRERPAARLLHLGRGDDAGPGRAYFEIDDTLADAVPLPGGALRSR